MVLSPRRTRSSEVQFLDLNEEKDSFKNAKKMNQEEFMMID